MKRRVPFILALAGVILTFSGVLFAHHGSGISYDLGKMVTADGVVTEFQWRNPHVYLLYDVKDADGKVVNWGAETHAPVVCQNEDGWTKDTLKPGDKVTVSVFPSKIGAPRGLLAKVVLNGKVIIDDTGRGRVPGQ